MNVSQRIESVSYPQTVLVIDDNPTNLSVMADYLTAHNLTVLAAQTGEDGLEQAQLTQPNLILLDVILSGIDGFETYRRLKADPKTQDIPVILMTVLTGTEHKLEGFRAGVVDYVTKPFEKEQVLARISTQLRLRELTEHLEHKVEERTRELTAVNKQLSAEITERKRVEESLRHQAFLLENVSDAIISSDVNFIIQSWNQAAKEMYGWSADQVIGRHFGEVAQPEYPYDERDKVIEQFQADGFWQGEVIHKRKDGTSVHILGSVALLKDDAGNPVGIVSSNRDITERKQIEEQIQTALKEKSVLLQELYHRTKNNMNVISSMLDLQAARIQDDAMLRLLQEMDNRIQAMALVHQKLYQAQDLSSLDLSEYITDLAALVFNSYKLAPNHVELVLDLESVPVLIDTAIPCGLVLNELFSNALQHAFPGDRKGEIRVQLVRTEENVLVLQFSDNGVGMLPGFDPMQSDSLGLQTIFGIIDHQLQGEATVDTRNGVVWHICFRDDLYGARV